MNIQEEFDKLSQEEKREFLIMNIDKETTIDAFSENEVHLDELAEACSYDEVQAFILDYAVDYGLVVGSDGDNLTSRFLEENQVSIDEVMECYSEEEIDNWLKNRK